MRGEKTALSGRCRVEPVVRENGSGKPLFKLLEMMKKRRGLPALMTHVVLGFPTLRMSMELVRVMADHGASLIELQIPFSEPYGDGPTITGANAIALAQGVTPIDCMHAMYKLAYSVNAPLLFMSYCNPLLSYPGGIAQFCRDAAHAGAKGLIVPDLPPEEDREGYWTQAQEHGLAPIPLVSPTTPPARMKLISRRIGRNGFVYCVSTTAVTGARAQLPKDLRPYLRRVREQFAIPIAVGFGISTPEHIRALKGLADIAVVGSATIDLFVKTRPRERRQRLAKFIESLTAFR